MQYFQNFHKISSKFLLFHYIFFFIFHIVILPQYFCGCTPNLPKFFKIFRYEHFFNKIFLKFSKNFFITQLSFSPLALYVLCSYLWLGGAQRRGYRENPVLKQRQKVPSNYH